MQEFTAFVAQTNPKPKPKLSVLLPFQTLTTTLKNLNPVPQKYRPSKRLRRMQRQREAAARAAAAKLAGIEGEVVSVTKLQTSFAITDSIKSLKTRRWSYYDLQHVLCFAFILFSMFIAPSAPVIKTLGLLGGSLLLLMPVTRQFFLPGLPIWTYLIYFFCSRFIAPEYRPHIWVKVLPALENVLYGANLSNILSAHTHPILDVLAWLPYGIGHFALPAICSAIMFLFAAPGTTPVFARAFGYMCMFAVTVQLIFPCTPPWYEKANGLEPAHYGMEGSPAGLARIDELFGVDMYTTSFTTAPVPFGAFPSLHAGNAVLEALFMQYCFPRMRAFFVFYVCWIWWSTMYLNHHYAIDLVGGGILAAIAYYVARVRWLPRPQLDKSTRWEYEYVEYGDRVRTIDEEYGYASGESGYGLGALGHRRMESDEWTLGSSSSLSSLSRGDGTTICGSSNTTPDILSPTTPEDEMKYVTFAQGGDDVWNSDGRLARDAELNEVVVVR